MRIRTHTNPLTFKDHHQKLIIKEIFPLPSHPLDIEIGFGRGVFLRKWAKNHPERNIIGIEVRKQIVEEIKEKLKKEDISNVHVINTAAHLVLEKSLEPKCVENIFIFHPDPWFKNKHNKRRVIQNHFLMLCEEKLSLKGQLHISTDVPELWEYMIEEIKKNKKFTQIENNMFWEEHYETHWSKFSKEEKRTEFFGSFKKLNP